jgi:phosphonate transport system substrate-binding protein
MFLATHANANETTPKTLSFGVVPQQSASKLARLWLPVLERLEAQTGYKFVFKTAPNIPTFEARLKAGEYDLSYMNPYHFTTFHESPGYQAIAHAREKKIKGIIVVHKNSSYVNVEELNGQKLAFPAPAAFAASIITRAHLTNSNIEFTEDYVSSHDSVYRAVARGIYPAGGGIVRTLNNLEPKYRKNLRILWTSKGYTPHAIAYHPRIPLEISEKIQHALIEMHLDPKGSVILQALNIKGFQSADNHTWDDVRGLGLNTLNEKVTAK